MGTDRAPVEAYLDKVPDEQRAALETLRDQVRSVIPDATEVISYGMPTFRQNGKFVISYAAWKSHLAIYPLTDRFLDEHADQIAGYARTKGSVHFTPERPLPPDVVTELVRARVADLEAGRR